MIKTLEERRAYATAATRKWRKDNPEKFAAQKMRWKKNRERSAKDIENALPGIRKTNEDFYTYICRNWYQIKRKKEREGREFKIWPNEIEWPEFCPIFGIKLDYNSELNDNRWSLDRIDSTKDYIPGNVKIISLKANRIKNNGTADEHEKIAKWMREQNSLDKLI